MRMAKNVYCIYILVCLCVKYSEKGWAREFCVLLSTIKSSINLVFEFTTRMSLKCNTDAFSIKAKNAITALLDH